MLDRKNKIVPEDLAEFSAADTIEETLSFYHITQTEFAKRIGISEKTARYFLRNGLYIAVSLRPFAFLSAALSSAPEALSSCHP